jgi:hypothetical protein
MDWGRAFFGGGTSGPRSRPQTPTPFPLLCSVHRSRRLGSPVQDDRRPRRAEEQSKQSIFCSRSLTSAGHRRPRNQFILNEQIGPIPPQGFSTGTGDVSVGACPVYQYSRRWLARKHLILGLTPWMTPWTGGLGGIQLDHEGTSSTWSAQALNPVVVTGLWGQCDYGGPGPPLATVMAGGARNVEREGWSRKRAVPHWSHER